MSPPRYYLSVHLSEEEQARLEKIQKLLAAGRGSHISRSDVIRWLLVMCPLEIAEHDRGE